MRRPVSRRTVFGTALVAIAAAGGLMLQAEPQQAVGAWAATGGVADARPWAASVPLSDGRTLIAGGVAADGAASDRIVIYDPVSNSAARAGRLLAARAGHTATLLENGTILVVGGMVDGGPSADLEIFDPASATSSLVGTMAQPRSGHGAARLANGQVLIVGGASLEGAIVGSAEVFDPASGGTTLLASGLGQPRAGASATTLIDGRVLVAGGTDGVADLATAEIFDPSSSTFSATGTRLSVARNGHTAVLLPHNNSVLIAGGAAAGEPVSAADLFLPAEFPDPYSYGTGSFAAAASMASARTGAVGGPGHADGYAFVAGGGAADAERYRFATIKTDKDDYAPGERAVITGSGWQPGKKVRLLFQEDPAVHDDYVLEVTADEAGNIYWDQWAPDEHDLGVRFYLMASDAKSRAQTTFTDGNVNIRTTGAGTSQATVNWVRFNTTNCSGAPAASGSISASTMGNGTGIPAGADAGQSLRLTAEPIGGHTFANWTGDVSTTSPDSSNPICVQGRMATRNIQVNYTAAPTTVNTTTVADSASATYGAASVTLSASVTPASGPAPNVGTVTFTIKQGAATIGTAGPANVTGGSATANFSLTGVNASTYTVEAAYSGGSGFNASNNSGQTPAPTLTIGKAATTTTVTCGAGPFTYTGSAQEPCSAMVTGPGGLNESVVVTYAVNVNAGTATATAAYAESANHLASSDSESFTIDKATPTATLAVTNSPQTYNASPQAATVTISTSSVPGTAANVLTGGAATQTNAGTYAVTADFVPDDTANYNTLTGLSAGTFVIEKATPTATLAVTNSPQTYNGSPQSATVNISASSVPGAVQSILTDGAATQTNAGTYAVTADFVPTDTANYNTLTGLAAGNFVIQKATPAVLWNDPAAIVYGTPLGAAQLNATATGVVPGPLSGSFAYSPAAGTTLPPGIHTLQVAFTPADTVNYNSAGASVTLHVTYGACSVGAGGVILQPINSNGTSVFSRKGGSTVPVKFRVCDVSGTSLSAQPVVFAGTGGSLTMLSAVRGTITSVNEEGVTEVPDAAFRWDATGQQWIFNMATSNLTAGTTYTFRINLAYGAIDFTVGIR